jgi:N-acetylmuramoyl-L-alanine amidase
MKLVEAYLTLNEFSRPGRVRRETLGIAMHYLGADGQTAMQCRDYFEGLKRQDSTDNIPDRSASAHEIIDHNGDVYLTVPIHEKAYHCGSSAVDPASGKIYTDLARKMLGDYARFPDKTSPNSCLVGIEMCHGREGSLTDATIQAAMMRAAGHCLAFKLNPLTQIFTHEEIVGWKKCPLYWSKRPALFEAFKKDVARIMLAMV